MLTTTIALLPLVPLLYLQDAVTALDNYLAALPPPQKQVATAPSVPALVPPMASKKH